MSEHEPPFGVLFGMKLGIALTVIVLSIGRTAHGQSAAEHIAIGDREHSALNAASALKHYEAALALEPNNSDALIKAAYDAVDLGEFNPSADQRTALYRSGEQYARRAVAANPNDPEAHFQLARAVGRNALTMGPRDRVKFAREVHDQALEALRLDPKHSGALHVMGVWNAEVMRLNGLSRMIAKNFLGGRIFGEANWDNAQTYLERAVELDPSRIAHRLDLAAVYVDRDRKAKAIEQYEWIGRAPVTDFNDPNYKTDAARRLKDLR
jgi:tetratricopeptide (TPR) repeat protein